MRCRARKFFNYWLPPLLYQSFIFILSSSPSPQIGPEITHIDKLYHTILYAVFTLLLWRAFSYAAPEFFKKRAGVWSLLIAVFLGITDEWHQSFVPSRDCDVLDFIFDSIGAGLAIIGINIWNKKFNNSIAKHSQSDLREET